MARLGNDSRRLPIGSPSRPRLMFMIEGAELDEAQLKQSVDRPIILVTALSPSSAMTRRRSSRRH
jgi:hypothetical protein